MGLGIGLSRKYFTTFKTGQALRFKTVSASIQISLSWLVRKKCCVPKGIVLHYGWWLAIVKVLSTAEIVLKYKAVFFRLMGQLGRLFS